MPPSRPHAIFCNLQMTMLSDRSIQSIGYLLLSWCKRRVNILVTMPSGPRHVGSRNGDRNGGRSLHSILITVAIERTYTVRVNSVRSLVHVMSISVVFILPLWLGLICRRVLGLSNEYYIPILDTSVLGQDPQTVNRLNSESFQQDVLVTFNSLSPTCSIICKSHSWSAQAISMLFSTLLTR